MRFFRILLVSVLISLSCSYIIMSFTIFTSPNEVMNGQELIEEVIIAIILGIAIFIYYFVHGKKTAFLKQHAHEN